MNIINVELKFKGNLAKRKNTTRLFVHHAVAITDVATIHKWHQGRGWAGIGYNYYIRKDGSVYQGRGWEFVGAHCAGNNSNSIGICFEGNYEVEKDMPEAQYKAGVELIKMTLAKYPTITEVCGHKKYGATACPGQYFPLTKMVADAKGSKDNVGNDIVSNEERYNPSFSDTVKKLQEALNADNIKDASGNKLVVDGYKGTNTYATIKKVLLKSGELNGEKYKVGSTGQVVTWVQVRLNVLLKSNLVADGKFGTDTRVAVGQWQKMNNLTIDYKVGGDTLTSLL